MSKTLRLAGHIVLAVVFMLTIVWGNIAHAATYTIDADTYINGGLAVKGDFYADHNNVFFNAGYNTRVNPTIDFMLGQSKIKEMGDLYIISDDYVHIGVDTIGSLKSNQH